MPIGFYVSAFFKKLIYKYPELDAKNRINLEDKMQLRSILKALFIEQNGSRPLVDESISKALTQVALFADISNTSSPLASPISTPRGIFSYEY